MPLTTDRPPTFRPLTHLEVPVAANAIIFAGALVARNAAGYLVPVTASTTLFILGTACENYDNTGGANAARNIKVDTRIVLLENSTAGDLITIASIGLDCYGVDDQTVGLTSGTNTRSVAGKIIALEPTGQVWVQPRITV